MTARLKSEIWVQAFLRRLTVEAKFGAVLHVGHADAGAVMVIINHLDGSHSLLVPAAGPAYDNEGIRRFELRPLERVDWPTATSIIAKYRKSDSDMWVVEAEDKQGLAGLVPLHD